MKKIITENYIEILEKYDSETDWEFPKDVDWKRLEKKSLCFVEDLRRHLDSIEITTDDQIQDASFHLSIFLGSKENAQQGAELRLSNFGQLITGFNMNLLKQQEATKVKSLILSHGFCYIPVEELTKPYNGKLKGFDGDWLTRFFDYM